MKINVPKIIKQVNLAEYAPEIDTSVDVWVNPPRAMMLEFYRLKALSQALSERLATVPEDASEQRMAIGKELNDVGIELVAWHAAIWSQGQDEERHWTADEVNQLIDETVNTDPMLWYWLMIQTQKLIAEHRSEIKKV